MNCRSENLFCNLLIFVLIVCLSVCSSELSDNVIKSTSRDKRDLNGMLLSESGNPSSMSDKTANGPDEITDLEKQSSEEDLQERLQRLMESKNDEEMKVDKRARYFLGKRILSPDEVQKRIRYFLGKRSGDFGKRMRYFVGKRDSADADVDKRMRYFLGKRSYYDAYMAELAKRMRYFVGKRMRYFVGKRDGDNDAVSSDGLSDFNDVTKRMRYFVGKRDPVESSYQNLPEKRQRYFLG